MLISTSSEPPAKPLIEPISRPSKTGEGPVPPAGSGDVESDGNSASTLIEAPVAPDASGKASLQRHDFPDGGGSGGAEAFRRKAP